MLEKGVWKSIAYIACLIMVSTWLISPGCRSLAGGTPPYVEGELLVKFKEGVLEERAVEVIKREGGEIIKFLEGINVYQIRLTSPVSVPDAAERFMKREEVEYAEPNYKAKKAR